MAKKKAQPAVVETRRTILPDMYAVVAALVRESGLSIKQALNLQAHTATLLFDARGGYDILAADRDALDYDRAVLKLLNLVPRASAVSLEEALGLNTTPAMPVVEPETSDGE